MGGVVSVPNIRRAEMSTPTCGTTAAYHRHKRHGERVCEPCRLAFNEYRRNLAHAPRRVIQPCGTIAAYRRHRRHGERPCDACQLARREFERARYVKRVGGPRRPRPLLPAPPCGTINAYDCHKRRGEAACEPCMEAMREYKRRRRALALERRS